jgi:hypothetical protein
MNNHADAVSDEELRRTAFGAWTPSIGSIVGMARELIERRVADARKKNAPKETEVDNPPM